MKEQLRISYVWFVVGMLFLLLTTAVDTYAQFIEEKPENAPWREKHRNKRDLDGHKQGLWRFFTDEGVLQQEMEFVNDRLEGVFKKYYTSSGQVMTEYEYLDGKKDGEYRRYYLSGDVSLEGVYERNKKTGRWAYYFSDGSIRKEGTYKTGKLDGIWKYYDRKGKITKTLIFENGVNISNKKDEEPKPVIKDKKGKNGKNGTKVDSTSAPQVPTQSGEAAGTTPAGQF